MNTPEISIVVPLYNEEDSFSMLVERLNKLMDGMDMVIEIILVDDGSRDRTTELMQVIAFTDERYQCIFLSRNFGHQLAYSAGLSAVRAGKAVMCIDGDLQDPPELLPEFYKVFQQGFDVVYGIRKNRKEGRALKLLFYLYYRIQSRMTNVDIAIDSGDFALLSRKVVDVMNQLPEESRYLRGLRSWVGFKQTGLEYDRPARVAGETKYSMIKLFKLSLNGIFNFSELPIRFITNLGIITVFIALTYFVYTLVKKFVLGIPVIEGFTGLMFTIILFSGVQLLSLGIIGEYVIRIFFQVKQRPLFIIRKRIVDQKIVED